MSGALLTLPEPSGGNIRMLASWAKIFGGRFAASMQLKSVSPGEDLEAVFAYERGRRNSMILQEMSDQAVFSTVGVRAFLTLVF
jgi:hypothetical protein